MQPLNTKSITIFSTHEEMDDAHYREAAAIDPVEGLRMTVELILRAYGTSREELRHRPGQKKITFVNEA